MIYENFKVIVRKISRKIVEAGSHVKSRGLYEYQEQYNHFYRCLAFLGENGVEGDILEYGVAEGSSIIMLDSIASELLKRRQNIDFRIFAFDSFEGLPEPTGLDQEHHTGDSSPGVKFNKGDFSCSLDNVKRNINKEIKNTKHITLVDGWYDKTLTEKLKVQHQLKKASFINIDCDFYESTKTALNWCEPLLQQGTIINFDDWYCYKGSSEHGEMLALQEFLDENPHIKATSFSKYSWHGLAFIISVQE